MIWVPEYVVKGIQVSLIYELVWSIKKKLFVICKLFFFSTKTKQIKNEMI